MSFIPLAIRFISRFARNLRDIVSKSLGNRGRDRVQFLLRLDRERRPTKVSRDRGRLHLPAADVGFVEPTEWVVHDVRWGVVEWGEQLIDPLSLFLSLSGMSVCPL